MGNADVALGLEPNHQFDVFVPTANCSMHSRVREAGSRACDPHRQVEPVSDFARNKADILEATKAFRLTKLFTEDGLLLHEGITCDGCGVSPLIGASGENSVHRLP